MKTSNRPFKLGNALLALSVIALVACGSDGARTGTDTGEKPDYVAAAEASVDELIIGTYEEPPSTAPPAPPGKNVWFLSCAQSVSICARAGEAVVEANELLGWQTTVFDTKFDPTLVSNGIRQAIAAQADAIILYAITCDTAKQALQEARDVGIKLIGAESYDCSQAFTEGPDATTGEPALYDAQVTYVEGDFAHWFDAYGKGMANWLIARTGGRGDIISFMQDDSPVVGALNAAYLEEMEKCSECRIRQVPFGVGDLGPELQQKAQQALIQFPNATGVFVPYDAITLLGVGAAIQASGRDAELAVMGGEGDPAAMDLVRAGRQQDAGIGLASAWEGYAAVDALIRVFNDEEPVGSGIGLQIYEQGHNVPPQGGYAPPVDFRAAYREAWGVG